MRLIPEYAPVQSLHLSFVHEFFNTRFHFGKAICQIIHAAHPFVNVEVWVSDADLLYFQAECERYLDGSEKFTICKDSPGRAIIAEYIPIFAQAEDRKGVGLVFEQPSLDNPVDLKQFSERFCKRHDFEPLELPFGYSTAHLSVNEDLVLLSNAEFNGAEREERLSFFTRHFPDQAFSVVPPLAGDITKDLDMFLWPIAPRAWIVSEYPEGSPEAESIAPTLEVLKQHHHTVHRVPGLPHLIYDDINTMPNYANGIIINQAALVPSYHREEDHVVCDILRQYGYQVFPIDCSEVILTQSAIHCITKTVPRI